jgi:hypothetical protein
VNPGHREISRFVSWHHLDYEQVLARAWVGASQGGVSEAIATTLSAAEIACADGRFAAEVIFRQTASLWPSRGAQMTIGLRRRLPEGQAPDGALELRVRWRRFHLTRTVIALVALGSLAAAAAVQSMRGPIEGRRAELHKFSMMNTAESIDR